MRALLFVATALAAAFGSAGLYARDAISWAPSFDAGQRQASAQGKLLLLHFYTQSCPPCRGVDANVFSQPRVGDALAQDFVCVKINAETQPEIAKKFKVDRWPMDVIVTPAGHLVYRTVSPQTPEAYLSEMAQAVAAARHVAPVETQIVNAQPPAAAPAAAQPPREGMPIGYNAPGNAPAPAGYDPNGYVPSGYAGGNLGRPAGGNLGAPPAGNLGAPPAGNLGALPAGNLGAPPAGNLGRPPAGNLGGYSGQYDNPPQFDPALAGQPGGNGFGSRQPPPLGAGLPAVPPGAMGYNAQSPPAAPPAPPHYAPTLPATNNWPPAQQAWNDMAQPPAGAGVPQQQPFAQQPAPQPGYGAAPGYARQPAPPAAPAAPSPPQVVFNPQALNPPAAPPQVSPTQQASANLPVANPQPPAAPPAPQAAPTIPAGNPPLGIEGYCPVSLIKEKKWVRGDVRWGAIHRGRTYLFLSKEKQEEFLKSPDQFSPMLSGFDPVKYADNGILVPGRRQHGLLFGKQIYLFSDEDAVNRFAASPARYAPIIRQAMTQGSETVQR